MRSAPTRGRRSPCTAGSPGCSSARSATSRARPRCASTTRAATWTASSGSSCSDRSPSRPRCSTSGGWSIGSCCCTSASRTRSPSSASAGRTSPSASRRRSAGPGPPPPEPADRSHPPPASGHRGARRTRAPRRSPSGPDPAGRPRLRRGMDGLWGFVVLAAVLSLTPGPDDVLVVGSAVRGGPRLAAASAAGIAVGSLAWGAASGIGLSGVLARSPAVYDGIRLTGAGYLVVLGLVPLLAPLLRRTRPVVVVRSGPAPDRLRTAFVAGLCSDLLNPKIGMFYLAGVPQFVPAGQPVLGWSLLLSSIDVAGAPGGVPRPIGLPPGGPPRARPPPPPAWAPRPARGPPVGGGLAPPPAR